MTLPGGRDGIRPTRSETEIGKLVHDLFCRDAAKMHFDVLKKRVSQFKNLEEGRRIMCKAVEEFAERRAAESKAEGKRETMFAMAWTMMALRVCGQSKKRRIPYTCI